MNPEDILKLSNIVYFESNMLQARIKMEGMVAENKQREVLGQSMAYTEADFVALIEEYHIYHNAFPFGGINT